MTRPGWNIPKRALARPLHGRALFTTLIFAAPVAALGSVTPDALSNDATLRALEEGFPSYTALLLRTGGVLAALIITLIVLLRLMPRFLGSMFPSQRGNRMSMLDSMRLGPGHAIVLVRFDDRTILLGTSPQGISLLAESDANGSHSDDRDEASHIPRVSFADRFRARIVRPSQAATTGASSHPPEPRAEGDPLHHEPSASHGG